MTMQPTNQPNHSKLVKKLVVVVIGMFGFGFALIPLYDILCEVTGLNGKTSSVAASAENISVDKSRTITVEFIANANKSMPWQFRPVDKRVEVYPGEVKIINFYAKNESINYIVGQAVPSVSPGQAASYFNKIECFCFNRQPLDAGAETLMPLTFYIDEDLPKDIELLTLSYTLYDVTEAGETSQSSQTEE
jgi:cytochrome c oxidase assembly protein subunit 11